MHEKNDQILTCSSCGAAGQKTESPSFYGELTFKDEIIPVFICRQCMKKPFFKKDRIIEKAFRLLGEKTIDLEG